MGLSDFERFIWLLVGGFILYFFDRLKWDSERQYRFLEKRLTEFYGPVQSLIADTRMAFLSSKEDPPKDHRIRKRIWENNQKIEILCKDRGYLTKKEDSEVISSFLRQSDTLLCELDLAKEIPMVFYHISFSGENVPHYKTEFTRMVNRRYEELQNQLGEYDLTSLSKLTLKIQWIKKKFSRKNAKQNG